MEPPQGTRDDPVFIDDGDALVDAMLADRRRNQRETIYRRIEDEAISRHIVIDLDDLEERVEEMLGDEVIEIVDLTSQVARLVFMPSRNLSRGTSMSSETHMGRYVREDGLTLGPCMFVELSRPLPGDHHATFLKIVEIVGKTDSGAVMVRGYPYTRAKYMGGMRSSQLNELVELVTVDDSDPRPWDRQHVTVNTPASNVKRVRKLRTTNTAFPEGRFTADELEMKGKSWVSEYGPLVCRFRYVRHYENLVKPQAKVKEWAMIRVTEGEADSKYRVSDRTLVNNWRGGNIAGGSYIPDAPFPGADLVDLESVAADTVNIEPAGTGRRAVLLKPGQQYTAGDTFSGAGGAARGIEQAGIRLVFGIDNWDHAVATLEKNFLLTDIHCMDVSHFIQAKEPRYRVDMLHLSPPCQPYSPAHTVMGKDDDKNVAALYACPDLIAKVRPRVFTLEQTFGLIHEPFADYLNLLLRGFTNHGYSIRWKVCMLADYGLAQPRKRFIIIGAGPGEKLPPFPAPTHSKDGTNGLLPYVTARQALTPLTYRRLGDHPMHTSTRILDLQRWCPDRPLPRTITCSGGQNYHWSGKRDFTLQEYALLQGFPEWHRFGGSYVKKQIGNAFPSTVVKVFYQHLAAWLDECDNVDRSTRAVSPPLSTRLGTSVAVIPPVLVGDSDPESDGESSELKILKVKRKRPMEVPGYQQPERARKKNRRHRHTQNTETSPIIIDHSDSGDNGSDHDDEDPVCLSDSDDTLRGSPTPSVLFRLRELSMARPVSGRDTSPTLSPGSASPRCAMPAMPAPRPLPTPRAASGPVLPTQRVMRLPRPRPTSGRNANPRERLDVAGENSENATGSSPENPWMLG